ncbi:MAG: ATP-dependent helicase HrpB [Bacteroidales bacterium]|nr:ATP-dependent helicase HrpB [Bacteroidales bacterium]
MIREDHLPVWAIVPEVNRLLATESALVVTAPPGAGKSTVLPLTMLEAFPEGKILMLEPRRIAARQIAGRMAALLGEEVGETVGYRIRFEKRVSRRTRIEVLTEGVLTRILIDDPSLEGVSAVLFDEFHERSLQTDLALALCRESQAVLRPDLKLVLLSATIDADGLCRTLGAKHIDCPGKMFPVKIIHTGDIPPAQIEDAVVQTIRMAHRTEEGDILAFLPGEGEIRRVAERLGGALGGALGWSLAPARSSAGAAEMPAPTRVCPLYGMLPLEEQRRAIAPSGPGKRKIVLATPVAETSLTIEGVRIVVDGGLCRKPVFDPRTALEHLETVRISKDMATQRAGRAGRVAPGVCYRLWSEAAESRMAEIRTPEILEADLAPLVLQIAAFGEPEPGRLPWLTPPPGQALRAARVLLQSLGALDEVGRLTPAGRAMAKLPCHPRVAKMLLTAETEAGQALAADIAALLEEKDPLSTETECSIDLRINALREARSCGRPAAWTRIARIAAQYRQLTGAAEDNSTAHPYEIGALVAAAYPERIAKAWKEGAGRFLLASGDQVAADAADALAGLDWLAVASVHTRSGGVGRIFLAAPVDPKDLEPLTRTQDNLVWDSRSGSVIARRERRLGVHLLDAKPLSGDLQAQVQQILCEAAAKEGRSMFDFSDAVSDLQRRVATVQAWHPELELPDLSTDAFLARAAEWLPLYAGKATSAAQLRKIDLCAVMWSLLSYDQQQAVERIAPSHIVVPTGSRIRLEYRQGAEAPVLRVRLQECFGLIDTPRVDGGKRPVLMELLSPGYKPVQLTSDLASFWNTTYFEVRKELRRRYPKHAWPDDPLSSDPVRGVRKKY